MEEVNLDEMTEKERRAYYITKNSKCNIPTFARHLIMRRLKKRYTKVDGRFNGLTDNKMCKIVDRIMELKVPYLNRDGYINMGYGLGYIKMVLRYKKPKEFKRGRVNYKKTLDYWAKNPNGYKKGIVIRDFSETPQILYYWIRNTSGNLRYYYFVPQRHLKRNTYNDFINGKPIALFDKV